MPHVQSISHSAGTVTIIGIEGSITLTLAQVLAQFASTAGTGTVLQRATATALWARQQVAAAMGIPVTDVSLGFDGAAMPHLVLGENAANLPVPP